MDVAIGMLFFSSKFNPGAVGGTLDLGLMGRMMGRSLMEENQTKVSPASM